MRAFPNVVLGWLAKLGAHELAVLLGLAGVVCGVWLFGLIAGEVMDGDTGSMDKRLLLSMRRPSDLSPIGPPAVQSAARDITALGGPSVLTLVTLITAGFLLLDGRRHMALFVCASIASGLLLSTILKDVFQRARPDIVPHADYVSTLSFPSGHSMLSAVTYLTLGALVARSHRRKLLKAYFLLVAAILTFLVGISRVYLGVHWPSDVLAGWIAGASWAIVCWLVARWLQSRHVIEGEVNTISQEAA
jgi:undecaprenyl-diphosphatase